MIDEGVGHLPIVAIQVHSTISPDLVVDPA